MTVNKTNQISRQTQPLRPRYYFSGMFEPFLDLLLQHDHVIKHVKKGELLWQPGQPHEKIDCIVSGTLMNYADHENGFRKIISFHGPGSIFPGFHTMDFQIELSLVNEAVTDMEVIEFTKEQFADIFAQNPDLALSVVNWYAMYVNRLLFEVADQEYNSSQVKLANLLYILCRDQGNLEKTPCQVFVTQEELAGLLGLSRVQVTRELGLLRKENIVSASRGIITILDLEKLKSVCSFQTLET